MSVREFFSTRYTFPGYTFLIFVVLISLKQIITNFFKPDLTLFTPLFAFIYLLSGAPLGYFVSQIWYLYFFHLKKGHYYRDNCNPRAYIHYLIDKYNVKKDPFKATLIADYLFHGCKNEGLSLYVNRRWDLYNVMGATRFSIIAGILFGFFIKFFIFNDISNYNIYHTFLNYDYFISFFAILLYLALWRGGLRILEEHDEMVKNIIKDVIKYNNIKLRVKFSDDFFEKEHKKDKNKMCDKKIINTIFLIIIIFVIIISIYFEYNFITPYLKILKNINRYETKRQLRYEYFDRNYTYIELVDWEHKQINFTKPVHRIENPFDILNERKGLCEEFSILYVSLCLAHNYDSRLVVATINGDHAWAEVKIDDKWITVDPSDKVFDDPYRYLRNGKYYAFIFAFEDGRWELITYRYNPYLDWVLYGTVLILISICFYLTREKIYNALNNSRNLSRTKT